jgi:hypothetical protein
MPVSRSGDVFLLGAHRIISGDARDPEIVGRLMRDDPPAQLLLTDEPYNVPIAGNVSRAGHREFAMASGEMSEAEYLAFNLAWMQAFLPFSWMAGSWRRSLTGGAIRSSMRPQPGRP